MKSSARVSFFFSYLLVAMSLLGGATTWAAPSTTVVISQVYGGGGNSGSTYKNDFIELHNISSSTVSITGWSAQYASATGTSWSNSTNLTGSIPAGGYFLVQEAAGTGGTTSLPTADLTGSVNLSGTAGKVALVNTTTLLSGSAPTGSSIVDFVGYGTTANYYEGTGPAPAPSTAAISDQRKDSGSTDTDSNVNDFIAGTAAPRNSSTTPYIPAATATQVVVENAANGSGTTVPAQTISVGAHLTAYAISRSSTNAFVSNVAASWSLTSVTGGVLAGDLLPSGDGKSAVFTPSGAGSGVISATVSGLTSTNSGTITVTSAQTSPTGVTTASSTRIPASGNSLVTVQVTPGGNPLSTGITVTADLSVFGGSSTTQLYDDGTHGDVTAGDGIYSLSVVPPANQAGGAYTIPITITDAQGRTSTSSIVLNVLGSFAIFHTNDFHARITPHEWIVPAHGTQPLVFQQVGGAAYQAAELLSLTSANPNSLVLDGGDISEGNPIGDFSGTDGTPSNGGVVGAYQRISQKLKTLPRGRGIDAWVVGNHDVRYAAYINNLKNQTDFPVISINVCNHGTQTPYFQPYVIVTVNGTKVGIVGYTTESSTVGPDLASTIDVVKCDWNSTNSSYIHLASIVNTLRNTNGCDVVILLTHDGHSDLCTQSSSKTNGPILADTSAAKIPEIAITGHWHTYAESVWQPSILNYKTIFTESSSFSHYVGELDVKGDGSYISSTQHVLTNSTITPDPDLATYVQNEINTYNSIKPLGYTNDQILGYTADDLVLDKIYKWWSADEYPWDGNNSAGNFICDAEQWAGIQKFGQCDLSMEVGGGVRADIQAGPLTFTNIYEMFPWSDDLLYEINMTGQEIWNFIQSNNCDAGLSNAWHVTATDGVISAITYNGSPINLTQTYKVAINSYIYQNNTFVDQSPQTTTYLCRQSLMDYAGQFPQSSPYHAGGDRYTLNTGFSGGYTAVVTMMNDNDSSTDFDDGFIRLMGTTSETLGRLGSYQVPTSLVNPDGTINHSNRLSEIEWYRSYLGFKTGALHPGDIVQVYGKGGFFDGDPEFVDSEGIQSNGVEFNVIGHDATLAQPEYYSTIGAFFNNTFKNHYVKFYAKKTGNNTVVDSANTSLTVMDVTAYTAKALPGNNGDLLQLTGVPTSETASATLRFRCDTAVLASTVGVTGFPPDSQVTAIPTGNQTAPIQLTATANIAPGSNVNTVSLTPIADAQVESGNPTTNYGTSNNIFIQSAASGTFGNERGWLKFDLSTLPAGTNIVGARLVMFNWKATGASLPAAAYPASTDSWTETGLTWNNQPGFGSALSTITLNNGTTNVSYSWDVTTFVQSEFAGDKTASLMVKAVTENSTDSTSPSYGFDTKEYGSNTPVLQIDTPSSGTPPTIASVQFFYRYSADGTSYGTWTAYQTVTSAPYSVTFNYPNGAGYYEFYSVATDSNGDVEPDPALYDTSTTYNISTQGGSTPSTDTPTMPQWGLIILGVMLFGFAATQLRTRMHLFLFVALLAVSFMVLASSRSKAASLDRTKNISKTVGH